MPSKASPAMLVTLGTRSQRKGMETAKVMAWLRRSDSSGEPSFWRRSATIVPAKNTPLTMARMFPAIPPFPSLSRKKRTIPPITAAMAAQSMALAFSRRKIQPSTAAYRGAVY